MSHAAAALQPIATLLPQSVDLVAVEAGIPLDRLAEFSASSGISMRDVHDIVIPVRTLKHRRARREPLSRDESDKFARLVRIFHTAVEVFGDQQKALRWMSKPKARFDERTPLQMIRTEVGGRMIEELLGQIDEGFFA